MSAKAATVTPFAEARRLFIIAAPLSLAYLSEYLMFLTTKLVVARLGYKELAAVGLADGLAHEILVTLMALLSVTGVLAAQAEGAKRPHEAGNAARQGLIVAAIISVPATYLIWNLDHVMLFAGQDEEIAAIAGPFVRPLAFMMLPTLLFTALRDFSAALSRTRPVMVIAFGAIFMNWALAEALVFGRWFFPEMGPAGAGLALTITSWAMFGALLFRVWKTPALRGYGLFKAKFRIDPAVIKVIFRIGVPIAVLVALEAGLFTAVGLMSGVIGPEMLAAHQILMSWVAIPFLCALGVAEGAMVRVAHGMGRDDPEGARRAGLIALLSGMALLTLMAAAPLMMASRFAGFFLPESEPGFAEVSAITAHLLIFAAAFQVFDGMQAIMARSLRALRDAYLPLWIGAFCYWVIGVGGGWFLAFRMEMGGTGVWVGLASGLTVAACLLTARFLLLTRRIIRNSGEG